MKNSEKFFENRDCPYFPCHEGLSDFNCLFCYCPLYPFGDCGGNFYFTEAGIKVCTYCQEPHKPENYQRIIEYLKNKHSSNSKK